MERLARQWLWLGLRLRTPIAECLIPSASQYSRCNSLWPTPHGALAKKPCRSARGIEVCRTSRRPPRRLPSVTRNSLIPAKNSLFLEIFSLLDCVGNYARSDCGAAVSCNEIGLGSPEIAKFPVLSLLAGNCQPQTGSYLTAHSTIQSFRTADFEADLKRAVSGGGRRYHSALPVSGDACGLSGRF
jgi:hypothetical protein